MVGLYPKSTCVPHLAMTKDYSGQNLRGRSFKGQNLAGVNFSYADIRGADFSNANLIGANFSNAKAGLQKRWVIALVAFSCFLSSLAAFASSLASIVVSTSLEPKFFVFRDGIVLTFLITLSIINVQRGISAFLIALSIVLTVTAAIAVVIAILGQSQGTVALALGVIGSIVVTIVSAATTGGAVSVVGKSAVVSVTATTLLGIGTAVKIFAFQINTISVTDLVFNGIATALGIGQGAYIVKKALAGEEKFSLVRPIAIAWAVLGGTSFRNADLFEANFTSATLNYTDYREANIIRTCWLNAKKFHLARFDNTYLEQPQVRQLVVIGQGQDLNFDHLNLNGVNLNGANLQDASFIGADLSQANLQDADLSRANLKQTQLGGTDFTGATLTGAFIEDWNITSQTKFNGVRCEYVYMRSPTKENPDPCRKPDNREEVFADGDFGDFIKPIIDTLDLYHNQGVDPRAIAIAFKTLAENNPDAELEIVAMEKRGSDKFLLRAKTAVSADKSELSAEYFDNYNYIKALPETEVKLLLAEKDSRIRSLETMVITALERPNFYAETYNNKGDTMSQSPKKQSTFNLQNAQFGGGLVDAETVNAHQIGGNITNNAQQQPTETKNIEAKTILILAANPKTTPRLRLDEEVREIDAGLQRAKKRELFDLKQRWAVRVQDVYQSLLDFKPQIVHFSGHGAGDDGLELEDETGKMQLVSTEALARLFELFASNIECVILNACYSEVQASAIAQHIPYVIGMNKEIGDKAAIKFATGFYSALGAGESVEFAYKLGCNVVQLDGIAEHLTPVLKKK
jgi:uncharacterized protein YjbI with pentapeptide repeats